MSTQLSFRQRQESKKPKHVLKMSDVSSTIFEAIKHLRGLPFLQDAFDKPAVKKQ